MAAFPKLGYGYKSNTSHIAKDVPASYETILWWRHISDEEKADLIIKKHPNCLKQSDLMRFALLEFYNKNPQKMFDEMIEKLNKNI